MESGGDFDLNEIAHFNGGLFDGRRALPLQFDEIGLLQAAATLDWSQIDPTIFGTLFERFLDPGKRAQIGAHYTDPDKIMLIVEPIILRPLREEWAAAKTGIEQLADQARLKRGKAFVNAMGHAEEARSKFIERLGNVTILDPACGSGNFLYLALQGVKDLELKANLECETMGLMPRVPTIGPEIVHGIEINPLAAELARTTIWIGDIQWRIRNGIHARPDPIFRKLDSIECRDALVTMARDGEIAEAQWPDAEFIVGNPPFLGASRMIKGLGEGYVILERLENASKAAYQDSPISSVSGFRKPTFNCLPESAPALALLPLIPSGAVKIASWWNRLPRNIRSLMVGPTRSGLLKERLYVYH
jgi:hypothetical protein